ncbi:MAG TPA: enoyl-CoA hydratase-related protein [Novosphingobium sp.]|nr:enoyl-CoA hydratase-related protein [Novosphingobium sp.]
MSLPDYAGYRALKVELRGEMLWLVIDNPPVNASSPELRDDFDRIFREAAIDPRVRCVVLTGAGETFSAGGDIRRMQRMLTDQADWLLTMREARTLVLDMLEFDKPLIGRINGDALGLGATLALCCDITIMREDARIGDTHVGLGLVAGDGGALLWPILVGLTNARRYLLSGDLITGREAEAMGLVTFAAAAEEFDALVDKGAARLSSGATHAIVGTKRALNMAGRLRDDHREAVEAFLDKRKPRFTGN